MPNMLCFCDCEYAGTDITQKDEKQQKSGKNGHESRKRSEKSKPEPGKPIRSKEA